MQTSRQALARAIALSALVVAILAIGVVIASNTGGGDSGKRNHPGKHAKHHKKGKSNGSGGDKGPIPATYTVKSGDTLTSIAADTGVPVVKIQELNPDVDPQILVTGQELKLR